MVGVPVARITVVTETPETVGDLVAILREAHLEVQVVNDLRLGLARTSPGDAALVLDVSDIDEVALSALRHDIEGQPIPVLVFTTSTEAGAGSAALDAGAAELLATTMPAQEVLARVLAVLRRHRGLPERDASVLRGGPVVVDGRTGRVEVDGRAVVLTALELKLLSYFLRHPDEPLARAHLLDVVWGYSVGGLDTVTVHVRRLREKIEADPSRPALIHTVWGVGYRFSPDLP